MTGSPFFETRPIRPREGLDPLSELVDIIENPEDPNDSPARRMRLGWFKKPKPAEEDRPELDEPPSWSAF